MTTHFAVDLGWRTLLRDLEVREAHVLRRAGLPDDLFTRPGRGLSTDEYFRFWQSLEAEGHGEPTALRVMRAVTTEIFSPALFAALCSATLTQAAQRLATYKPLVAPMTLAVEVGADGGLGISPRWLHAVGGVPFTVVVSELAFFLRLAQIATREPVRAATVTVPRIPEGTPTAAYTAFFGVHLAEGETPGITFRAADARRPFLTVNDRMWEVFEPELRRRLGDLTAHAALGERVSAALLELLPGGQGSLEAVAQRLNLSTRTLQRGLDKEQLNFRLLVNRTRERLARHYLTQTALPGGEIAFLLGFDDPNSFFRAFKEWTGSTPEALRRATTGPALH